MSPRGLLRLLSFALLPALPAADFSALQPQGYLNDFAQVVRQPAQRQAIESYLKRLEDSTGAQVALVTVPSLDGEPIEDVANLLFRKWGIGQKKSNEGVLLLLAIRERRSRVEVGYGLEPVLPDGFAGSVLREMRPALRNQDYGGAMLAAAETLGAKISQAKNVSVDSAPLRQAPRRQHSEPIPWLIFLVTIFGFAFIARKLFLRPGYRRAFPGAVFLPPIFGGSRSWSSGSSWSSGGGFGGYNSSGGFSGFGGGDSGGGGASSDW